MAEIPSLRLSCSMLSIESSSEKRIDVGSCRSVHWSSDSPRVGERLPPVIRAKGDSPLVLSTIAMMLGDPSAMSPSVRPISGTVTWATGGTDHLQDHSLSLGDRRGHENHHGWCLIG